MKDIKIFENVEFGELEILIIEGKEYFPATQCATILGYANPRKAIADHCKVAGVTKRDASSTRINQYGAESIKKYKKTYINEGNLYRLIIRSKLPSAEKFERWVFEEVLPSIRKTGGYATTTQIEQLTKTVEGLAKVVTSLVSNKNNQNPIKDRTKQARVSKRLTRKEVSEMTGVPYNTLVKYEQGQYRPSNSRALLLAKFLDLLLDIN